MSGITLNQGQLATPEDCQRWHEERERKDDFRLAMQVLVTIGTRMEFEATPFTLELIKLCKEKL